MKVAMNSTVSSNWGEGIPMVTCPDGTTDVANGFLPPCMGRDGKKPIGYSIPMSNRDKPETFSNVKCNDGSTQSVGSNPLGGRVDMPCKNNGGVSPNQPMVKPTTDEVKQQNLQRLTSGNAEGNFYRMLGIPSRPLGRLLVAVVLVAGYFAYKKFKK